MVDFQGEKSVVLLRIWDRNGCPPVCSPGSVCKSWPIVGTGPYFRAFNFYRRDHVSENTRLIVRLRGRVCSRVERISEELKTKRRSPGVAPGGELVLRT